PTFTAPLVFLAFSGGRGAGLDAATAGTRAGVVAAGALVAGALAGGVFAPGTGFTGFSAFANLSFDFKWMGFFGGVLAGARPDFFAFIPRTPRVAIVNFGVTVIGIPAIGQPADAII